LEVVCLEQSPSPVNVDVEVVDRRLVGGCSWDGNFDGRTGGESGGLSRAGGEGGLELVRRSIFAIGEGHGAAGLGEGEESSR